MKLYSFAAAGHAVGFMYISKFRMLCSTFTDISLCDCNLQDNKILQQLWLHMDTDV